MIEGKYGGGGLPQKFSHVALGTADGACEGRQLASSTHSNSCVGVGGGDGEISHGGPTLSHDRPDCLILLSQHATAPPGSLPQPLPPQVPQLLLQQVRLCIRPVEHVGSGERTAAPRRKARAM